MLNLLFVPIAHRGTARNCYRLYIVTSPGSQLDAITMERTIVQLYRRVGGQNPHRPPAALWPS